MKAAVISVSVTQKGFIFGGHLFSLINQAMMVLSGLFDKFPEFSDISFTPEIGSTLCLLGNFE